MKCMFCCFVMVAQTNCACPIILHLCRWPAEHLCPYMLRRDFLYPQDVPLTNACRLSIRRSSEIILKTSDF